MLTLRRRGRSRGHGPGVARRARVTRAGGGVAMAAVMASTLLVGMPGVAGAAAGGSISGTVTDASGRPLSDVSVLAFNASDYGTATTGASGTWTIDRLQSGRYTVQFQDLAGAHPSGFAASGGFTDDLDSAAAIQVSNGQVTGGIDVILPDGHHLTGTVADGAGVPEPNISIRWCRDSVCGFGARTDQDGAFSIVLAAGSYALAIDDAFGTSLGFYAPGGLVGESSATRIALATGDVTNLSIRLPVGANGAHLAGTVSLPGGGGAAGIAVQACTDDGTCQQTATRADGSFRLPVDPGSYRIRIFDDTGRYPSGYYTRNGLDREFSRSSLVTIGTADVRGLNVTLIAAWRISGRLTAPGGGPAAGIAVTACPVSSGYCAQGISADDGTYQTTGLVPSTYIVTFNDPTGDLAAAVYRPGGWTDVLAQATRVALGAADVGAIDVQMRAGTHVTGAVVDGAGQPSDAVRVVACGSGRACSSVETDADGHYRLGVAPGSTVLEFYGEADGGFVDGWLSNSGLTLRRTAASPVSIGSSDRAISTVVLSARPRVTFRTGAALSSAGSGALVPVLARWPAGSATASTRVATNTDGGAFTTVSTVTATPAAVRGASLSLSLNHGHGIRIQDVAPPSSGGTIGAAVRSLPFTLAAIQESSSRLAFEGSWATISNGSVSGGHARSTTHAGASVSATFTGRGIAWVGSTGPGFGSARVFIDGRAVATVSAASSSGSPRTLLWAASWIASGQHTVKIVANGTSGHPRIELDAFVVLQ